jgi:hypothetical protein
MKSNDINFETSRIYVLSAISTLVGFMLECFISLELVKLNLGSGTCFLFGLENQFFSLLACYVSKREEKSIDEPKQNNQPTTPR